MNIAPDANYNLFKTGVLVDFKTINQKYSQMLAGKAASVMGLA
jgi:hypothetical protein